MAIDIIFLLIIVFAVIKGLQKGLIVAVFSLLAFIIGLAAALKLSAVVAVYLGEHTGIGQKWLPVISFLAVFIVVVIIINLLAKMIETAVDITMLGMANKIGGVFFYGLVYTFIYSIILFYATQMHLISDETTRSSVCYDYIEPLAPWVMELLGSILPFMKDVFHELGNFFSGIAEKAS